jgi:predicted transcriptional regulator
MQSVERIVIRYTSTPQINDLTALSGWLCMVFGLSNGHDRNEARILESIIQKSIAGDGITSKEISETVKVPRSTVIYHLNRFLSSGLIVRGGRKYFLRSNDMASTIEEIESDMLREFNRLIHMAERFDQIMGENSYGRGKEPKTGRQRQRAVAGR